MRALSRYARDASFCALSLRERIELKRLCSVARRLDIIQAIPATSSNFSLRASGSTFLISRSGIHKRLLEPSHFIRTNLEGIPLSTQSPKPSDETLLHAMLYKNLPQIGSIVHCHARELEQLHPPAAEFAGHELLKALGKPDHNSPFSLPVFANSQDMRALANQIENALFANKSAQTAVQKGPAQKVPASSLLPSTPVMGFMLEHHGIYLVGKTIAEAEMRLEALLHLLAARL